MASSELSLVSTSSLLDDSYSTPYASASRAKIQVYFEFLKLDRTTRQVSMDSLRSLNDLGHIIVDVSPSLVL